MDGVVSMPIALAGFYFIPDLPENTRAPYLSETVSIYPSLNMYS